MKYTHGTIRKVMSPRIYCPVCSQQIELHRGVSGDSSCPHCGEPLDISVERNGEIRIRKVRPYSIDEYLSPEARNNLEPVERRSLFESSLAAGYGAYIAAEFMSLRALEGISRRYTKEGNWSDAIDELEEEYPELSGTIDYLRNERHKVAHPDKERSSKKDAEQTFHSVVRIIDEVFETPD